MSVKVKISMKSRPSKSAVASYVRNFVFGVEDSLVSTVGLTAGIATAGVENSTIVLTGTVLIFVEAFSMGIGSFLSEQSAQEYLSRKDTILNQSLVDACIMFVSYFVAGFIPLTPYMFIHSPNAVTYSVLLSLLSLFLLGAISGRLFKTHYWKSGLKMVIIGGFAIAVGIFVGRYTKEY